MAPDEGKPLVVVTGANGFVASHLIALLLAEGFHVRGTVRNPAKADSTAHLRALPGAEERLELVAADLNATTGWAEALAGATHLAHTASPYALEVADAERDLVRPAVDGTERVLAAAAQVPTLKRVVVTSSMAAVTDEPDGRTLTEADWNEKSSLTRNPYYYSKVAAEKAAYAFVEREKPQWSLVTLNPYIVIGAALGPGLNPSNQILVDLVKGTYPGLVALWWGFIDVRDLAEAHLKALFQPSAQGRYLLAAQPIPMAEAVRIIRPLAPAGHKLPSLNLNHALGSALVWLASWTQGAGVGQYLRSHIGRQVAYSTAKAETELGLKFRPVAESLAWTMEDLKAKGAWG